MSDNVHPTGQTQPAWGKAKKKWLTAVICFLLILCSAAAARWALNDRLMYNRASKLLDSGDYAAARELFTGLDCKDSAVKLNKCDYGLALELLENGDYTAARAAFDALGNYGDSADMSMLCRYRSACALMDAGDYAGAAGVFQDLESYSDSAAQAERCMEQLYGQAELEMQNCRFEAAADIFSQLGSYSDSPVQLENCNERISAQAAFDGNQIITAQNMVEEFKHGKLYLHPLGLIYVPDELGPETSWLVYFPGGCGERDNLSLECIWYEHGHFDPDAVMVYLYSNGYYNIRTFLPSVLALMKQTALECGIWFHDVATVGSSNGCFTAIIAASAFYSEMGLTVENVLAFDAGCEWQVPAFALLAEDECEILSQTQTAVYLFEQHNFSDYAMDIAPVAQMINCGVNVIIVECENDGHNHIGPDAIRAGAYQWAVNQQEQLDSDGFAFKRVSPDGSVELLSD